MIRHSIPREKIGVNSSIEQKLVASEVSTGLAMTIQVYFSSKMRFYALITT
jgi:hypothetical protein